jgi:poly-gamma-glutamate capsule biosynthesis protein CapA/YwtB (metallophosphatase superfamily)
VSPGARTIRLALAGDAMLGRGVAERLGREPARSLFSAEVVEIARSADLFVLNLECCISDRGEPWPDPHKPFFFRAPPSAVEALALLGVDCVTCANNHALDYGEEALLDTLHHLSAGGIASVGAGRDVEEARRPAILETRGLRIAVVGATDHPEGFAAGPGKPGVAFAELREEVPAWLREAIGAARAGADVVLVTPHWGPNMSPDPVAHVRRAAPALLDTGATVVAGHSAHVFQGVDGPVLYDLGDFIDDYAVDRNLRNDLGLLWVVELGPGGPTRIEAVPLRLDFCHTRLADGPDRDWIVRRLLEACAEFETAVAEEDRRLVITPS